MEAFDELAFFAAVDRCGARAVLIGRRCLVLLAEDVRQLELLRGGGEE